MKKVLLWLLLTPVIALLVYWAAAHVYLLCMRANIACYIHDTPAIVYDSRNPPRVIQDEERGHLRAYYGFTDEEFDDYREHHVELYRLADLQLTIVNDTDKELFMPRLIPPENVKYWFDRACISECWGHGVPENDRLPKTVTALIRIADEASVPIWLDAQDFSFDFQYEVDFGLFRLKDSIPAVFPYPGESE